MEVNSAQQLYSVEEHLCMQGRRNCGARRVITSFPRLRQKPSQIFRHSYGPMYEYAWQQQGSLAVL